MRRALVRSVIVLGAGLLFWEVTNLAFGTQEPWDAPSYWAAYLIGLGISATFGYIFEEHPSLWAFIFIFAQLPVMMVQSGNGPLFVLGLIYLMFLSVPAILIATATSRIKLWRLAKQA